MFLFVSLDCKVLGMTQAWVVPEVQLSHLLSSFLILKVLFSFVLTSFSNTVSPCGIKDNYWEHHNLEKRNSISPNVYQF